MNIKDVAKLSDVSITTVSFVLNGKTNKVSEKTRQKVLKVMKEIGYEASGAARDLKSKKTKTIGVFFDFIYGPFISSFVAGIQRVIWKNGYDFFITDNCFFEGDFSINSEYAAGEKLLEQKNRPEAVICSNDEMAFGLIQRLKENNIKIPDDISIVGFDDLEFSKFTSPKLTTIKGQTLSMGKLVAETIFRGIAGEEIEGVIKLPSKPTIRESA